MDRVKHFLWLNYQNFKFPFYYCGIVSVLLVLFMNFCFTQYNELTKELQTINQLDYANIYQATLLKPEEDQDGQHKVQDQQHKVQDQQHEVQDQQHEVQDTQTRQQEAQDRQQESQYRQPRNQNKQQRNRYEQLKNELSNALEGSAVILNYRRNPLYTTINYNRIVPIQVITAEEAAYFHLFDQVDVSDSHYDNSPDPSFDDIYYVIAPDNLKKQFKPGSEYSLPVGLFVHEDTWKIKIHVIDTAGHQLLPSSSYGNLTSLKNSLLIFDPNNTLPLHLPPGRKPVFHLYLSITDNEKAISTLKNFSLTRIEHMQNKIMFSPNFKSKLLPSYFKFLLLGIFIYLLLSINVYVLFYYKKKNDIIIFNYCNLNRKFYQQCIGMLTILQLCFGLIFGQLLWFVFCKLSGTTYWHNEWIFIPLLALIHLGIFIFLNRGYTYLVRTYH